MFVELLLALGFLFVFVFRRNRVCSFCVVLCCLYIIGGEVLHGFHGRADGSDDVQRGRPGVL